MEPDAQIAITKEKSTSAPGLDDANARLTKSDRAVADRANTQQNRARYTNYLRQAPIPVKCGNGTDANMSTAVRSSMRASPPVPALRASQENLIKPAAERASAIAYGVSIKQEWVTEGQDWLLVTTFSQMAARSCGEGRPAYRL